MDVCFGTTSETMHNLEAYCNLASKNPCATSCEPAHVVETIQNRESLVILPLPSGLVRERLFCENLDEQVVILGRIGVCTIVIELSLNFDHT